MEHVLPLFALAVPSALLLLAIWLKSAKRDVSSNAFQRIAWINLVAVVPVVFIGVLGDSHTLTIFSLEGLGITFYFDGLSTTLLAMIGIIGFVVMRFTSSYLQGEPRADHFKMLLVSTLAAVELLVISGNLVGLVLAWMFTSLLLQRLLLFYPSRIAARAAAKKKFVVARMSDASMILATLFAYTSFGTAEISELGKLAQMHHAADTLPATALVAGLLFVLAAAFKSAQFPVHGWLVEVMETPTPVSALLHAGLLNAGPYLILRLAMMLDVFPAVGISLLIIGAVSAAIGSLSYLFQPAIKTALGYSSLAHMGFSLMLTGCGFYSAALLHLVGHSFYKAHLFLSAGSAMEELRNFKFAPIIQVATNKLLLIGAVLATSLHVAIGWLFMGSRLLDVPQVFLSAIIALGTTRFLSQALQMTSKAVAQLRLWLGLVALNASFFVLEGIAHHALGGMAIGMDPTVAELTAMGAGSLLLIGAWAIHLLIQRYPTNETFVSWSIHLRNGLYANAWLDRVAGAWNYLQEPSRIGFFKWRMAKEEEQNAEGQAA